MPNTTLYQIDPEVKELTSHSSDLEKNLQTIIEQNMERFFGIRFLATEYQTTDGRIDSIGLDENNFPVIFEYKRSLSQNVINQGLFYLDWMLDHGADIRELVRNKLGRAAPKEVNTDAPRIVCVAADFTKYDIDAVRQIDRNIDLIRYQLFDKKFLLFEQIYKTQNKETKNKVQKKETVFSDTELLHAITDYIRSLGDDITEQKTKYYIAFKKIKNFACVSETHKAVKLYLTLKAEDVFIEPGFTRDVSKIGHWGTGDLEVTIHNWNNFEKAKYLIQESYRR